MTAAFPCPTCSGPARETVGMVCQTCGTDYALVTAPAHPDRQGTREERAYPVNDLTGMTDAVFQAMLRRVEAADEAEESLRERLADTFDVVLDSLGLSGQMSSRAADYLADAALDVIGGAR